MGAAVPMPRWGCWHSRVRWSLRRVRVVPVSRVGAVDRADGCRTRGVAPRGSGVAFTREELVRAGEKFRDPVDVSCVPAGRRSWLWCSRSRRVVRGDCPGRALTAEMSKGQPWVVCSLAAYLSTVMKSSVF